MKNKTFLFKCNRIISNVIVFLIQYFRIKKYRFLSFCSVSGKPILNQPVLFSGDGKIIFNGIVNIGIKNSAYFLSSYGYFEARKHNSIIVVDNGVFINNNSQIISDGAGIFIGENTIAGPNLTIYDSDFHNIHPDKRSTLDNYDVKEVHIKRNVFIGSNVTILKGVTIGENSIIANGSIVSKDIAANVIAGGIPAIEIKKIFF